MRFALFGLFFTLKMLPTSASAQQSDDIIWVPYPEQGVVLGQGYNLLSDEPTQGVCVDFIPVQDPSQEVSYRFEEVTSHTTINASSKIHASGSLKMALVKASAQLDFYSKEKFSIDTEKFLLSATVTNSSLFAAPSLAFKQASKIALPSGLTPTAQAKVLDKLNELAFPQNGENVGVKFKNSALRNNIRHCGQGYIAAIASGAKVDAFLTMSKSDAEAVANIKAGIKASIGGIFSVSGSFEQNQQSINRGQRTEVSVYRYGGKAGEIAYDLKTLRKNLEQLTVDAASNPKPVRVAVVPYSKLDDSPLAGGHESLQLADAIAVFFLARDVSEQSGEIIDWYRQYDADQIAAGTLSEESLTALPIYLRSLNDYVELNDRALDSTQMLSKALSHCQNTLSDGNLVLDAEKALADIGAGSLSELQERFERQKIALNASNTVGRLKAQKSYLKTFEDQQSPPSHTFKEVAERKNLGNPSASRVLLSKALKAAYGVFIDEFEGETGGSFYNLSRAKLETALQQGNPDATAIKAALEVFSTALKRRIDFCSSGGEYMKFAVEDSLDLSALYLVRKPIFWNDLGRHYQARVWRNFGSSTLASGSAQSDAIEKISPELVDFHAHMVVKKFRRDICERDLSHPICGPLFVELAEGQFSLNSENFILAGLNAGLQVGVK